MKSVLVCILLCGCGGKARPADPLSNTNPNAPASSHPNSGGDPSGGGGDRDGDGVSNPTDLCPIDPEDFDGFQDEDGCPDADNDKDGILDVDDLCPNQVESANGNQDTDGCPD